MSLRFDGGTIETEAATIRCRDDAQNVRWQLTLRNPDSYFNIGSSLPQLADGMLLITSDGYHVKDDSPGFRQLHRVGGDGKLMWTVTPDVDAEGMLVRATTTGILVVAPWDEPRHSIAEPIVSARLIDRDSGAELARHAIPLAQNRPTRRFVLKADQYWLWVRAEVSWDQAAIGFGKSLPASFGKPR
jgi:hypothetical protein